MTPDQIKRAAAELEDLNHFRGVQKNYRDIQLMGLKVRTKPRGGSGSQGSMVESMVPPYLGLSFTNALQDHMTKALQEYLEMQIDDRERALKELGVNLAPDVVLEVPS